MKRMFRLSKSFFNRSFLRLVVAALFLGFLVYFIRNEHLDLTHISSTLSKANPVWIIVGVGVTLLYLLLQGVLYVYSFKSIGVDIRLKSALRLFLKRNFVGTFLPAGTFTSLAFFNDELESYKLPKAKIHYGSFLFALASLISIVLIAIPALAILLFHHQLRSSELYGIIFLLCLIALTIYASYSLTKQTGILFTIINRISPEFVSQVVELGNQNFRLPAFIKACLISVAIEVAGVFHLYIALAALGFQPSLEASMIGYVIMIIILSISPFLRGLGAVEVSVTYVLTLYGYPSVIAASVTLLFRFFEFWLPFFVSASIFLIRKGNLLLRVFPAFFILLLGTVNIISALTPALPERLKLLQDFIPFSITELSNIAVLLMGIILIVSSGFLLTGARSAWRVAMIIGSLSLFGHLTKAFDYEEAIAALTTLSVLWYTRRAYFIKYDFTFNVKAAQQITVIFSALFLYSLAGFYLLHARHLDFNFNWTESLQASIKTMAFMTDKLAPQTKTGLFFIYSIQLGSALLLLYGMFLLYMVSKKETVEVEDRTEALSLLERYGNSSMDYFKLYPDKQLFFNDVNDSFLAYAESKHYAVVLENPVARDADSKARLIQSFEHYCSERGLRTFYYRVTEDDLPAYLSLKKKAIKLGQEAIVDVTTFSLEGAEKKSMRNAIRKIEHGGYHFNAYYPPLKDGLIQQLSAVSNDWLSQRGHSEAGFSQGIFKASELKKCAVLTVESNDSKILAFINVVPSYKKGEGTYDLIRQTSDSPNGVLDYLVVKMIEYFKDNDYKTLNLGLAPLAGMEDNNLNEQIITFYKKNFKQASRLKGLFDYKSKFEPRWENRYLIYDQAFDLVRFPMVLSSVSKVKLP